MHKLPRASWFGWRWLVVLQVGFAGCCLLLGADPAGAGEHSSPVPGEKQEISRTNSRVESTAVQAVAPPTTSTQKAAGEVPAPAGVGEGRNSTLKLLESADLILHSSNLVQSARPEGLDDRKVAGQRQLDEARLSRQDKNFPRAIAGFSALLAAAETPEEIRRTALIEMALATQQSGEMFKALQVFTQFVQTYPEDASVPEVLLRQGLIYRDMGAYTNALNKFFAVLSSSLAVKFERIDYYQRLVLQAQTEIGDTYYLQGKHADAAYNYARLLRLDAPDLDKARLLYKNIQCLAALERQTEVVGQAEDYLKHYSGSVEEPEVRYQLATALKRLGRNQDAMQQVQQLLASQQTTASSKPELWAYWQQRTGNDIANQLYKEGDYTDALAVYQQLAGLDGSAAWRMPALYQVGLVFERLRQPAKAVEAYEGIIAREAELSTNAVNPNLLMLMDMAKWRKNYLSWQSRVETDARNLAPHPILTNVMATAQ